MKVGTLAVLYLVLGAIRGNTARKDDLAREIDKAKQRLQADYILKLWYDASQAISESQAKLMKIYTEYTIQQAQHVIDHLSLHQNKTRLEHADHREAIASVKNLTKVMLTLDCLYETEENTLQAFKVTGYNLHNCIRMAQNEMEEKYLTIAKNLKNIKKLSMDAYDYYAKNMDNCVQTNCITSNLFKAAADHEKLKDHISTNLTEINYISTRYVFSHIAMGCVSGSLTQISQNYEIGRDLISKCLLLSNDTNNATETLKEKL